MPLLAGVIAAFFGFIAEMLAKKLTVGLASAAAFVATALAAWIAVKAAIAAVAAGISATLPSQYVLAVSYFLPTNLSTCLTAILLADTIVAAYDFWRGNLTTAAKLAQG